MADMKQRPAVAILSVGAIVVICAILVYKITVYIGEVAATRALLTPMLRDVFHGAFMLAFSISVAGYVRLPPLSRCKTYFELLAFTIVLAWLSFELYSLRTYEATSLLPVFYLPLSFALFIDVVSKLKKLRSS